MSSLTGHARITSTAVKELAAEMSSNPLAGGLKNAGLPTAAVMRDLFDVLSLGHWSDFGQSHHFMRKFDSQSEYEAYEAAIEWIRTNALRSVQDLAGRLASVAPRGLGTGAAAAMRSQMAFSGISWQPLGNAIHALEDSFAPGHATRAGITRTNPGAIDRVKSYAGAEKVDHEKGDDAWADGTGRPDSDLGHNAVEAVKALLKMVILTAQANQSPRQLDGWQAFRDKWLKAAPVLSKAKDRVFELIDRYATGIRVGATNVKTVNMDEEGLAKALLTETPPTVLKVFERLDDQYNSDADDVAEIYVNLIRKNAGPQLAGLKANRDLIQMLIKVMDEGWTSAGEQECIKFLKGLK